jgi:small subunit ribosomal protein S2
MEKYIFGKKNGIHIIDLEKTVEALNTACDFLSDLAAEGGIVLFVGTKRQAQDIIKEEAKRCGMFYVTHRWLGGLLTNFTTIRKSIEKYKNLEKMKTDGTFEKLTKKEIARLSKEMEKLRMNFEGIMDMERLPQALFIVDVKSEDIAVREANKLSIPICGLIDTNSDPDKITYPIPGNDDAIKSIRLITSLVADSIMEGRKRFLEYLGKELVKEDTSLGEVLQSSEKSDTTSEEKITDKNKEEIEELVINKEEKKSRLTKSKLRSLEENNNKDGQKKKRAKK